MKPILLDLPFPILTPRLLIRAQPRREIRYFKRRP